MIRKILVLIKFGKKNYINTIGMVAAINLFFTILALVKDIMFASYMGTSSTADALLLAFFIPDMIGNSLIASTLGTVCVPMFSRMVVISEKEKLYRSIIKINIYFLCATCTIMMLLIFSRYNLIRLLANGFSESTFILCSKLMVILLPTIPLFSSLAIGISANQVFKNFNISAFSSVIFNLIYIMGILLCIKEKISPDEGTYIIATSILMSVILMVIFVYIYMIYSQNKNISRWSAFFRRIFYLKDFLKVDREFLVMLKMFIPYFFILFLSQIILYIEKSLASGFKEGSIASLNYVYRLSQVPSAIFIGAIGTVIFPMISTVDKEDTRKIRDIFNNSIKLTLAVSIPMTLFLIMFKKQIITFLFLRGAFDLDSLNTTTQIMTGYLLSIIFQSISAICFKFFLAFGEINLLFIVFSVTAVINIGLDYYLVRKVGLVGLGLGAFFASIVSALLLIYIFKIRIGKNIAEV